VDYIERLKAELNEVEVRLLKLANFVDLNPIFDTLAMEDQRLMLGQLGAMTAYVSILGARFDRAKQLALPL
jgi:hypothetical protein